MRVEEPKDAFLTVRPLPRGLNLYHEISFLSDCHGDGWESRQARGRKEINCELLYILESIEVRISIQRSITFEKHIEMKRDELERLKDEGLDNLDLSYLIYFCVWQKR